MKSLLSSLGFPCVLSGFLLGTSIATPAEDAPPASGDKKVKAPATHTVTRGSTNKAQLDAVIESVTMKPVSVDLKVWTDLTVVEAVPHGARVKKGEELIKFDTEKLVDQIEELELSEPGAKLALELAIAELANLEQTTPLKLQSGQRLARRANEDYDYFQKTDRAQREKSSQFSLKSSEQRLRNANEELAQLKKMYDADDLTEETEEIILERQKFAVESAQFFLDNAKLMVERDQKTVLPREHETLKANKLDQELVLTLAEQSLPMSLNQKRLTVVKLKRDQKKNDKKLSDYKADLASLTVRAPRDGMVYYGACEQGKWTTGSAVAKKLIAGGKLSPREIFMTIVDPNKLVLRAVIAEDKLSQFKTGLEGQASPLAAPDQKLSAKIEDIDNVPLPGGGFGAAITFENKEKSALMPGMSCKVSFGRAKADEAILVPKTAVFGEGDDRFVFMVAETGRPEKRSVKTGEADGNSLTIVQGLSEGDKILLEKPE